MRGSSRNRWLAVLRTPTGALAVLLLVALFLTALLAPLLWSDEANRIDTAAIAEPASAAHWFGTDELGRDIFFRTLVATRLSLSLALLATAIGVVGGVVVGALPSLVGRSAGRLVTALINIAVAFPALLLVLFFAVVFGVGGKGAVLALGIASAPFYARLTQTLASSVAGRDFVTAARVAGVGRLRLLLRHILPNIGEQLAISAAIGAGSALLAFAALSFLGLGIQPPLYDWGRLLNGGLHGIYLSPLGAVGPAVVIVLAGLAFNLFGETAARTIGLRSYFVGKLQPLALVPPAARAVRRSAGKAPLDLSGSRSAAGVLVVENLHVAFPGESGWSRPVRGVSFSVAAGEAVGIVGESGSGKSLTSLAVSGLIEPPGEVLADRLEFDGDSLLRVIDAATRRRLGLHLAMVFQDPMTSFNPVQRIGRQLSEVTRHHEGESRRRAMDMAAQRLGAVRIAGADRRVHQYPHEFSGGERQRAMIAMGLMGQPKLTIADEPTTALDVTVQRQVLRLLDEIRRDCSASILFISHDITVVEQLCSRVLVMYAGRIVEEIPAADLRRGAKHPYTRALLGAVPDMETTKDLPLTVIPGRPPEPDALPGGCAFAPRCRVVSDRCLTDDPGLLPLGLSHSVACWHPQSTPPPPLSTPDGSPSDCSRHPAHE